MTKLLLVLALSTCGCRALSGESSSADVLRGSLVLKGFNDAPPYNHENIEITASNRVSMKAWGADSHNTPHNLECELTASEWSALCDYIKSNTSEGDFHAASSHGYRWTFRLHTDTENREFFAFIPYCRDGAPQIRVIRATLDLRDEKLAAQTGR